MSRFVSGSHDTLDPVTTLLLIPDRVKNRHLPTISAALTIRQNHKTAFLNHPNIVIFSIGLARCNIPCSLDFQNLSSLFRSGLHSEWIGCVRPAKVREAQVFTGERERADNDQNEMKESVCSSF